MIAANPASDPACSTTCGMWRASGRPPPAAWRAVISGSNLSRVRGSCRRGGPGSSVLARGVLFGLEHPLGRQLRHGGGQAGGIAAVDDVLDARECLVNPLRIQRRALGGDDLLGARGARALVRIEEVLVHLLARARADDL